MKLEPADGGLKLTQHVVNAEGRISHFERILTFDGKEYPSAQQANTTNAYTRIDARTYQQVEKVDGKITVTTRVVVSGDGKTRTATATGTNPQGQAVHDVTVYDKQ